MRRMTILMLLAASAVAAEKNVVPLAVGNRWEYAVTQYGIMSSGEGKRSRSMEMASQGTCVEEVISIKEKRKDGVVYEYRSITKIDAGLNTEPSEVVEDTLMLASDKGIAITAGKASGMDDLFSNEWAKYDPPLISFAFGLKAGSKWKIGTVREGNLRMPMEAQVTGVETVTVPAGTFENCLKIYVTCSKVTGTMGSGADMATIKSGKSVDIVWISPTVGVVRQDTILQAKMLFAQGNRIMTGTQHTIKGLLPGYRAE